MPYNSKEKQGQHNRKKYAELSPLQQELERVRKARYAVSEKGRATRKAHYESRKEYYQRIERDRQYRTTYGITLVDYEQMLARQNGACAVCGGAQKSSREEVKHFSVDHCHKTGKVRGLLCFACNQLLGRYEKHRVKIDEYLALGERKAAA